MDSSEKQAQEQQAQAFLRGLVGKWRSRVEAPGPGGESRVFEGISRNVAIGESWLALDSVAETPGGRAHGHLLLGYDRTRGGFDAAGVNSLMSSLNMMSGILESESTLILEYSVPDPTEPKGSGVAYRDLTRLEGADRYVVTTSTRDGEGEWETMMSVTHDRIPEETSEGDHPR